MTWFFWQPCLFGRALANTFLECWMCLGSWCLQNKMYFRHIRKMNVIFTWYFEMLSDVADSEFTALDTIPSTACCPKDPGLGVILTPGGPRQGWSEEDEEGQIFWDAKKWICWYESIVLGAWISPPKKKQTPEMMSTGAVDVHVLFLNSWETSIRCL